MAKVKRVEAKIILQKNDEGYWLLVDSPSGKHAMVNIENVFKGGVLQRRSKSYLWGTRAYLLASRVKSDTLTIAFPNGHD